MTKHTQHQFMPLCSCGILLCAYISVFRFPSSYNGTGHLGFMTFKWTSFPEYIQALYFKIADPWTQIWLIVFILCATYAKQNKTKKNNKKKPHTHKHAVDWQYIAQSLGCVIKKIYSVTNSLAIGSVPSLVLFFLSFSHQHFKNYGV